MPVLVLGGPKTYSDQEFLASIRGALDAGAAGVVIGRNVWQSAFPAAMTQALVALVHRDVNVDDALHILHESR
ncbi:MAG: hypothetical protein E6J11_10330 [Chloroflexi bacterium]|nr:MAG: hypothetical protein E6J11_10330 [Chloroflexota bacterium]